MGCKICTNIDSSENTLKRVMDYIERDDTHALDNLIRLLAFEEKKNLSNIINEKLIQSKSININFLTYAVSLGRTKVYQYLIQKLNASIDIMEDSFNEEGQSVINFLCEKGYIDLIKIYLPRHISNINILGKLAFDKTSTLSFSTNNQSNLVLNSTSTYTPIQIACNYGYVSLVLYFIEYFSKIETPIQFDVHYIDETTGENCALIAARNGNFIMIKVLNEKIKANFHLKNKNNEGALQIVAAATKINPVLYYLECIMYLIDVVQIDITYMYEETLLLLENKIIISHIENKLERLGIKVTKREIEEKYRIRSYLNCNNFKAHINEEVKGDSNEISAIEAGSIETFFGASPQSRIF